MQIMTCSIEKILGDAKLLVNRLKDHDTSADTLISQSHCLKNRIEAMKQVTFRVHPQQAQQAYLHLALWICT